MGIERHYIGKFIASPEAAQRELDSQAALETQEKRSDFEKEFNLSKLCQEVYAEHNGKGAFIPTVFEKRLITHVTSLFSELNAEHELKEELIRDELQKMVKINGKKSH